MVRELPGRVLECNDPLFDEPYCIGGEASVIEDPVVARLIQLHWQHNAQGLSTRHLTQHEGWETKAGAGRWSSMGHQISAAVVTAKYSGTPAQIMYAALHDAGKRKTAHLVDDLLDERGKEDGHEKDLPDTLRRNGFIDLLYTEGLVDETGRFIKYKNLTIDDVLHPDDSRPDFTNQPGRNRSMEAERLQYIGHEGGLWIVPFSLVREAMKHAVRRSHAEHGEHIVFDDPDAATLANIIQTRCSTEHWNDQLDDVKDEFVMTLDRRLLTYYKKGGRPASVGRDNTGYYPGDVLYIPEEDWRAKYYEMAEVDPFTSAILKIMTRLVEQQRDVHGDYDKHDAYKGPVAPGWLTLQEEFALVPANGAGASALPVTHKIQGIRKNSGNNLTVEMLPGKERIIDPWVVSANGLWRRLSDVNPESARYRAQQSQWLARGPYQAQIDFGHKALGLTPAEKRSIGRGLADIQEHWPKALRRPKMNTELLTERFARSAERTRLRARGINPDQSPVRGTQVA